MKDQREICGCPELDAMAPMSARGSIGHALHGVRVVSGATGYQIWKRLWL